MVSIHRRTAVAVLPEYRSAHLSFCPRSRPSSPSAQPLWSKIAAAVEMSRHAYKRNHRVVVALVAGYLPRGFLPASKRHVRSSQRGLGHLIPGPHCCSVIEQRVDASESRKFFDLWDGTPMQLSS